MFYAALINVLRSYSPIAETVTVYNNEPAIFSDEAPEKAIEPYIVVRIDSRKTPDSVIIKSDVYIDYWDYDKSRDVADKAAEEIENRLDTMKIISERVTDIRFSLMSADYVKETDPRTIHHNTTFSTRAARSKWMQTI